MTKKIVILILLSFLLISCSEENLSEYNSQLNFSNTTEDNIDEIDVEDDLLMVHITGEILRSGVYEMKKGDRVIDVVKKAGGFTVEANQEYINLAEKIKDGMKIHIPNINDKILSNNTNTNSSSSSSSEIIDINIATKEELMKLPSVGEKMSDAIIKYREEYEFTDFKDLLNVPGIGKKRLESFKGLISIGGHIYE